MHPHFEILEVKKHLIGHLKLPPCARRIKRRICANSIIIWHVLGRAL